MKPGKYVRLIQRIRNLCALEYRCSEETRQIHSVERAGISAAFGTTAYQLSRLAGQRLDRLLAIRELELADVLDKAWEKLYKGVPTNATITRSGREWILTVRGQRLEIYTEPEEI